MGISMQLRRSWHKTQETNQLPFPATTSVKTALLGSSCIAVGGLTTFADGRWRDLCAFGPQALAGSTAVIMRAAAAVFGGELALPTLDCAVFVLTELGTSVLGEADREVFWRAFLVPVFELCVDRSGNLIAAECEAHDGWHLTDPNLEFLSGGTELFIRRRGSPGTEIRTGMKAERARTSCCCGNEAPVIRNIRMLERVPVAALAATA
jgi:hypothetical protein